MLVDYGVDSTVVSTQAVRIDDGLEHQLPYAYRMPPSPPLPGDCKRIGALAVTDHVT